MPLKNPTITKEQAKNDSNKFQLCQQNNISLCIIDTSSQKSFTELSSQKFLKIITEIITYHTKIE